MGNQNRRKSLELSKNATIENKLTYTAHHLTFWFEKHVNFEDRIIRLTGEVDEEMFDRVDSAMTEFERRGRSTVTIRINSPGGSTYQAMAIIGRLLRSKCDISTEGYGHVMSAATLILACGKEGKRKISQYAWFMHHEASYDMEGKVSEHEATLAQIKKEEKFWCQNMVKFTKRNIKFWETKGVVHDAYFTPEQLISYGVADEII
jgi:ATP-dependent Clp endopeptidase proteolytic subunit ClpP